MKVKAIHQYVPDIAYGDGISRGVLFTQKILQDLGYRSNIYILFKKLDIRIKHNIYHIDEYKKCEDDLFLIHYSGKQERFEETLKICDKKIMIYHNITPAHFFGNNDYIEFTNGGRKQLKEHKSEFLGVIADSPYNAQEVKFYQYSNVISIPLLVDLEKLKLGKLNNKILKKYQNSFNILFVGRIIQNKSQHQLVDIAYELKCRGIDNFKIIMIGGNYYSDYLNYMKENVKLLGLEDIVEIPEHISDEDLNSYYKRASLYLSLSEHEGFGMPLIEAMSYDIPVLAYNTTAISTTTPESSHLDFKSVDYIADKVEQVMKNKDLQNEIITQQRKHIESFRYEKIKKNLQDYLENLNI